MTPFRTLLLVSLVLTLNSVGAAQQGCRLPAQTAPGQILFTPEQEAFLGRLMSQMVNASTRVIEDDSLRAPLVRIGKRLAANAPETGITPHFTLVDLPEANAFTLPGGQIYVTKKLVATVHNEDELAGVLAHEMGHAYTRQIARDYSEIVDRCPQNAFSSRQCRHPRRSGSLHG